MGTEKSTNFSGLSRLKAAGLAMAAAAFCAPLPSWAEIEIGRLAVVSGDVRLAREAAKENGEAAKANDPLYDGDTVKTGNGAAAKILFSDQSIMDVGPNSAFKVTDYDLKQGSNRTGTFTLMYGKLRALVTKQVGEDGNVQVRTKDAVMGVRGTEFVVDQPKPLAGMVPPPAQIAVISGRVQVFSPAGGPPVVVGAGQLLTASAPGPAGSKNAGGADGAGGFQVHTMSAEQATSVTQAAKTQDNTFLAAVTIAPANQGPQGAPSGQAPNAQSMLIGGLVSANLPPPAAGDRQGPPPVDVPVLNNTNFLPPASVIVGGLVRLTISIQ